MRQAIAFSFFAALSFAALNFAPAEAAGPGPESLAARELLTPASHSVALALAAMASKPVAAESKPVAPVAAGSSPEFARLSEVSLAANPRAAAAARAVRESDARLAALDAQVRATPDLASDDAAVIRLDRAYAAEISRRDAVLAGVNDLLVPGARVPSGSVVSIDDAAFDPVAVKLGMRDPAAWHARIGGGIYLLEPFSAEKAVVLLVHGMNGSPRDFREIIGSLDRTRYQIWVAYYAAGDEIRTSAEGVGGAIAQLLAKYPTRQVAVITHSLGGTVWRARELFASTSGVAGTDPRISAIYTLCAFHRGVHFRPLPAVRLACRLLYRWLPVYVDDIMEGSPFMMKLAKAPVPSGVRRSAGGFGHNHLWYRDLVGSFIPGPDDGLVPLSSTKWEGSADYRTYDADHVTMLEIPPVLSQLSAWLSADVR